MATTSSSSTAYRPSSTRPSTRSHHSSHPSTQHIPFTAGSATGTGTGTSSGGTGGSSSYRHEEDAVIIELGARYLRAGFEGESSPMCVLRFSPEDGRRVGDYRGWIQPRSGSLKKNKPIKDINEWCKGYELWSADMRNFDIGLFEDRLERAIREVYNKYLLTDAGNSKIVLVLPSIISHQILSAVLSTIFNRWKHPSITLLPSATMAAVSAGLRTALIVDIGWEESVVTGVYEYREVKSRRSIRATKLLMHRFAIFLSRLEEGQAAVPSEDKIPEETTQTDENNTAITIDFDTCEEVMNKLSWCRRKRARNYRARSISHRTSLSNEEDREPFRPDPFPVTIPLPSGATPVIPFGDIADIVEETLFVDGVDPRDLDDEEMPLDYLVYTTLLDMSPDVRGMMMARIVFTGGGSEIVGVRQRTMDGVERLVERYGWSAVRGMVIDRMKAEGPKKRRDTTRRKSSVQQQQQPPVPIDQMLSDAAQSQSPAVEQEGEVKDTETSPSSNAVTTPPLTAQPSSAFSPTPLSPLQTPSIPAHAQTIPPNPIDTKLARQQAQSNPPPPPIIGTLRHLTTLGPWCGASLTTSLNVKGVVEIERERFLKEGVSGWSGIARRETAEHGGHHGHGHGHEDGKEKRKSGLAGKKDRDSVGGRDRGSWTLGGWA
ncbi:Actin-like protein [Ascosphaera apis ARSEF 7405]|uniref:Actin-like protein n=1 Tax=Ascosphaera apis ARSEF 7405 TaxID=392613 RepID=A0A162IMN4_9EURO|nr:Actin-like protein [Ascosphaera apis ARSEF 7405]